jgi:SHS2 domain-containing protein
MRRYRRIAHTADTGLIAYGATLREAFANAAYGLLAVMVNPISIKEKTARPIEVSAPDIEGLLFACLNKLIYIFDTEHFLCKRLDIKEMDDQHLRARCWGEKYDPVRHHLITGVKSATYYWLEVNREKPRIRVIFDI